MGANSTTPTNLHAGASFTSTRASPDSATSCSTSPTTTACARFWPFSEKWYSWDIVFIFEPVMFAFLLLGLIIPSLFGLIDKEIGARRTLLMDESPPRSRSLESFSCGACATMNTAAPSTPSKPAPTTEPIPCEPPLIPSGSIHSTGTALWRRPHSLPLRSVDSLAPEVDPEGRLEIRYKPEETPVTLAAKNSYIGRVFLDWAKYPITETESLQPPQEVYIVLFQDLRFAGITIAGRPSSRALSKAVKIDKNLHVVGDVYETKKGQLIVPEPD